MELKSDPTHQCEKFEVNNGRIS
ncbi:hypothetical protein CCACVL1_29360, partial [Corchorus capsularis]